MVCSPWSTCQVGESSSVRKTLAEPSRQQSVVSVPHGNLLPWLRGDRRVVLPYWNCRLGCKDRTIRIRSTSDGFTKDILTLRSPTGTVLAFAFSPDGRLLYSVTRGETAVRVWHLDVLRQRLRLLGMDWE